MTSVFFSDHGPLTGAGIVADHGLHPDQNAVLDNGVMDHGHVADDDLVADADLFRLVDDDAFFHGGFIADIDGSEVRPDDGPESDITVPADGDRADDFRAGRDPGALADNRPFSFKFI